MNLVIDEYASGQLTVTNSTNYGVLLVKMGAYQKAVKAFSTSLSVWKEDVRLALPIITESSDSDDDSSTFRNDVDKGDCNYAIVTHQLSSESKNLAFFQIQKVSDSAAMSFMLIFNFASCLLCLAHDEADSVKSAYYRERSKLLLNLSFEILQTKLVDIDEQQTVDDMEWLITAASMFLQASVLCADATLDEKIDQVKRILQEYCCFYTHSRAASAA
jgi:hypothetical protein